MASKDKGAPAESSGSTAAPPKAASKAKSKTKADKVKTEYDMSRAAGPDPRDPRTAGPPCHGNHVPMPAGRGSLSGANAHGRWEVCKECRLRLLYVPAFGAHAHYRQAGPLPADVKKAVEIMEERVAAGEPGAKEILNAKAAALQGAEDSLLRRLETVRSQKAQAMNKAESSKAKDGYPDNNPSADAKAKDKLKERGAQPKKKPDPPQHVDSDSESSGMSAVDEPRRIPKKSAKRQNAKEAELQEAQGEGGHVDQGQSSRTGRMILDEEGFLTAPGNLDANQAGAIRDSVKEILDGFDGDVAELPRHHSGIHLLEVGTSAASGLRTAVEQRHGAAARMSPFEFDFGRKAGADQALEAARALTPALLWISMPSAGLELPANEPPEASPEQHKTWQYRRKRGRKMMKTALRLAEDQVKRGGHVAWEWPKDSPAWKEPEVKGFLRKLAKQAAMHVAVFEDKAVGKVWRIVATSPALQRAIVHAQAATSERRTPSAMSRSLSVSSRYPEKLCKAIAEFALQAEQ